MTTSSAAGTRLPPALPPLPQEPLPGNKVPAELLAEASLLPKPRSAACPSPSSLPFRSRSSCQGPPLLLLLDSQTLNVGGEAAAARL
jgi:hypothetical protein